MGPQHTTLPLSLCAVSLIFLFDKHTKVYNTTYIPKKEKETWTFPKHLYTLRRDPTNNQAQEKSRIKPEP